jgi:hypothetical protein
MYAFFSAAENQCGNIAPPTGGRPDELRGGHSKPFRPADPTGSGDAADLSFPQGIWRPWLALRACSVCNARLRAGKNYSAAARKGNRSKPTSAIKLLFT